MIAIPADLAEHSIKVDLRAAIVAQQCMLPSNGELGCQGA